MKLPHYRPTIVVLGGINMDLIGITNRLPIPGETVKGDHFYTAPGGKGANQAVAAARMGAEVRMIGRIGNDMFGQPMLEDLNRYGIDTTGVAIDPEHASGVAVILLDNQRQNHIVAIYGANIQCDNQQLSAVEKALDGADALMLQLETPYELSLQAARAAMQKGVTVIWDPAPPLDFPSETFSALNIITPNQTEAEALTGIKVTNVASAHKAADILVGKGAETAIVKLGEQGAVYATSKTWGHVGSFEVVASDTVAAGDAFGGAFAVSISEGKSVNAAVSYGTAAGALAVTKPGAQESMPSREEIENLMSSSNRSFQDFNYNPQTLVPPREVL